MFQHIAVEGDGLRVFVFCATPRQSQGLEVEPNFRPPQPERLFGAHAGAVEEPDERRERRSTVLRFEPGAGYFQKYDTLLCPVIPFTAPLPGQEGYVVNGEKVPSTHMMRSTVPFNLADLPALSVPFTFISEQLPINVQLVSRGLDEATILRLGALIEAGNKAQHRHPNL